MHIIKAYGESGILNSNATTVEGKTTDTSTQNNRYKYTKLAY
jgi:hypothetical protein